MKTHILLVRLMLRLKTLHTFSPIVLREHPSLPTSQSWLGDQIQQGRFALPHHWKDWSQLALLFWIHRVINLLQSPLFDLTTRFFVNLYCLTDCHQTVRKEAHLKLLWIVWWCCSHWRNKWLEVGGYGIQEMTPMMSGVDYPWINRWFSCRPALWVDQWTLTLQFLVFLFAQSFPCKHLLSQWSFRIFLSEHLQTSVDLCCLHQAWLGCSYISRMARRLPLSQAPNRNATLAAWTALIFAVITALAVWGVANAYPPTLLLPWSIQGHGLFPLSCELRLNCFAIKN